MIDKNTNYDRAVLDIFIVGLLVYAVSYISVITIAYHLNTLNIKNSFHILENYSIRLLWIFLILPFLTYVLSWPLSSIITSNLNERGNHKATPLTHFKIYCSSLLIANYLLMIISFRIFIDIEKGLEWMGFLGNIALFNTITCLAAPVLGLVNSIIVTKKVIPNLIRRDL